MKLPSRYVYKKATVRAVMRCYDIFGNLLWRKQTLKTVSPPKKIGFFILHQIGDVVMCLPTVSAIMELFPEARGTLIAGSAPAQLIQENTWNMPVHIFDAQWHRVVREQKADGSSAEIPAKAAFLTLVADLQLDMAIVFFPDVVVNQLLGKSSIPTTFGFMNAGGGFWLTHPVDMPPKGHQVERNFALAAAVADTFQRKTPVPSPPQLETTPQSRQEVHAILKKNGITENAKLAVLHPFGSAETKNWLPSSWGAVITWLKENRYTPIIIGSTKDTIPNEMRTAHALCGQLSLPQSLALLEKATLFIGIDSGPAHMAAAVGTPVISVFSSVNDPNRWHPYGKKATTIILHRPVTDRKKFPYELRDLPPGTQGNPYSDMIGAQNVIAAIKQLKH